MRDDDDVGGGGGNNSRWKEGEEGENGDKSADFSSLRGRGRIRDSGSLIVLEILRSPRRSSAKGRLQFFKEGGWEGMNTNDRRQGFSILL